MLQQILRIPKFLPLPSSHYYMQSFPPLFLRLLNEKVSCIRSGIATISARTFAGRSIVSGQLPRCIH